MDNIESVNCWLDHEEIEQTDAIFCPGAVKEERYTRKGMNGVNV
jgi:hypothetical protein